MSYVSSCTSPAGRVGKETYSWVQNKRGVGISLKSDIRGSKIKFGGELFPKIDKRPLSTIILDPRVSDVLKSNNMLSGK